ncbi:MAG: hypothetical protein Q4F21_04675 [Lachnospiraceae bacterium]|nr:hypothetical protein [Lachnospiraceae bacterium]
MDIQRKFVSSEELFSVIQELLDHQKQASFTVTGMSMWPFICHGRDSVILDSCDRKSLKTGDIILFQTPFGNYMLHRITKITPEGFETTGDGNCFRDGIFPYSCVKAKVVKIIRKGKTIDCSSPFWKIIFRIWMILFPVRKWILKSLRMISRAIHRK